MASQPPAAARRRVPRRVARLTLAAAACLLAACPAAGDPTGDPIGDPAVEANTAQRPALRRVYVPAGRPDAWPTGGQRFLPIDQAELAELLRQRRSPPPRARAERIVLQARISAGGDLLGRGEARVAVDGPRGSTTATVLGWPAGPMLVTDAQWRGAAAPDAEGLNATNATAAGAIAAGTTLPGSGPRAAVLGQWQEEDAAASHGMGGRRRGLMVAGPGVLSFRFRAPSISGGDGARRYVLPLPESIDRRLVLTLPAGAVPVADEAQIAQLDGSSDAAVQDGTRRWLLRPAAGRPLAFAVTLSGAEPAGPSPAGPSPASPGPAGGLQTQTDVLLAAGGAEVTTVCTLADAAPSVCPVDLPKGVVLLGAELDGLPTAGRPVPGREAALGAARRVEFNLSRTRNTTPTKLTLRLWADTQAGGSWRVPLPRVGGAVWEAGGVRLRVAPELRVVDVPITDGTLISAARPAGPRQLGDFRFALLRQAADIRVTLAPAGRTPRVQMTQRLRISPAEAMSVVTLTLPDTGPSDRPDIALGLHPDWLVESVAASPPGVIRDWFLAEGGDGAIAGPAGASGEPTRLLLQLAPNAEPPAVEPPTSEPPTGPPTGPPVDDDGVAATPDAGAEADGTPGAIERRPATVTVTCRRLMPSRGGVRLTALQPLTLVGATPATSRLSLSAAAPHQLLLSGSGDPPTGLATAGPVTLDLADAAGRRYAKQATATLRLRPPRLEADIAIDAYAAGGALKTRTQLTVRSDATLQTSIDCFFQPPLPGEPRWSDAATGQPLDAVRRTRLSPEQNPPLGGEFWTVRLPGDRPAPVTIVAEATAPPAEQTTVPLACVPRARRQTGRVVLRGLGVIGRR
ncbi:MAG: hypothetical protein AAF790_09980, partial [Planctomycetota bacterium]